ncbi:MAG: VTT domain-containing protein [Chloroflexi bacterium]|nr:VTT domain-containing protein [Chloroflexota bacterium]
MTEPTAPIENKRTQRIIQILALVVAVGVIIGIRLLPIDWRHLDWEMIKPYGYLGLFAITLVSDATVLVPFPGLIVVFLAGGFLNPLFIGLASGLGSAVGELTGYLAGYGGRAVFENRQTYEKLAGWMKRNGTLTIFILSLIPNPLFDMAGMMAGALKYPLWKFLIVCGAGKAIKFFAIALAGTASLDIVYRLLER